ncbi:hypothetical protein [Paenibacillus montanisoli]|uniref:Type II secretion system protein GspF domain-containing protein n=1 Tax=Paenibacillus montanisoli TaxID=2081970 RepID=A0A328TTI0_9BACL|nr:hypothetical protein [Paenibacillus montanisoli]RAP73838.1 hypothetical protein DL346_26685 [Paenibacillus montanisoli]
MSDTIARAVMWTALGCQYAALFVLISTLLRMLTIKKPRFAHLMLRHWRSKTVSERWLALSRISRSGSSFKERERLLAGCGFTGDAALYVLLRRLFFLLTPIWAAAAYGLTFIELDVLPRVTAPLLLFIALQVLLWDRPCLETLRKARAERMTKEIYVISNQLLYLAGSTLHIHTKLMRCLPYTRTMRSELQMLLGEWYHDAEGALRRLKLRLGTEEGLSFVETIDSLRLHESEQYYELLRERIQDYKEKLELAKDSRKESTSYFLFVLAGLPIMYTFQIFIYPWVREGQKLFSSLN